MKKFSIITILIIVFFIIYFLQENIFNAFTIAGIKPNLFIIYYISICCYNKFLRKADGSEKNV